MDDVFLLAFGPPADTREIYSSRDEDQQLQGLGPPRKIDFSHFGWGVGLCLRQRISSILRSCSGVRVKESERLTAELGALCQSVVVKRELS